VTRLWLSLAVTLPLQAAASDGEPGWEAGVAGCAGWVSDYPGADQAHLRGVVLPVVIYRGPVLRIGRIDREGIRGRRAAGEPDAMARIEWQ
jgi:outer membrane protein